MLFAPSLATDGSKVPFIAFVIPVPDQTPPGVAAVKLTGRSSLQNSPGSVIVPSGASKTSISILSESAQSPFATLYVIVKVPTPATVGLKVPILISVIPDPDQIPPGDTALRTTAASNWQNGPTGVIVASTSSST